MSVATASEISVIKDDRDNLRLINGTSSEPLFILKPQALLSGDNWANFRNSGIEYAKRYLSYQEKIIERLKETTAVSGSEVLKVLLTTKLNSIKEPEIREYVTMTDTVLHGNPVIKGTRVPVYVILDNLADGSSIQDIMEDYELSKEQVQACLDFASRLTRVF